MKKFNGSVEFDESLKSKVLQLSFADSLNKSSFTVRISPKYGSNIVSIKRNETEYIYTESETLLNHGFTGNYILFPFPNRIKGKSYTFKGKHYSLQ